MTRRSGILLHPTSLPGAHGSGDLGEHAYHFVDWLVSAKQTIWQLLPLGGVGPGHSPYMSDSAFAGNPMLIDLVELHRNGWLDAQDLEPHEGFSRSRVLHEIVTPWRMQRLVKAASRFFARCPAISALSDEFAEFRHRQHRWLDDYALFKAIGDEYPLQDWTHWPRPLASRDPQALGEARRALQERLDFWRFVQWCFSRQWSALHRYAKSKDIRVIGDMPIFVAPHSADVWSNQRLFQLDERGLPEAIAGVPPDAFTPKGQRWGNPLYRWEIHEQEGFSWWVERVRHALAQFDEIRIDHFRGFVAYWRLPREATEAIEGEWVVAPGEALFETLRRALGPLPVIAEDLGLITPDVVKLRRRLGMPGMVVLQFAWDGDPTNAYLPHNHERDSVVYSGTHDNDTVQGWWQDLNEPTRRAVQHYFGDERGDGASLLRAAQASVADTAILTLQDALGLGAGSRMNTPGITEGCWSWRFDWSQVGPEPAQRLATWARLYDRLPRVRRCTQPERP